MASMSSSKDKDDTKTEETKSVKAGGSDLMTNFINKEVSEKSSKKYLIFRPYIDPMELKPYQPPDRGYYFKFNNTNVKIV
jgi:hypothetical protein